MFKKLAIFLLMANLFATIWMGHSNRKSISKGRVITLESLAPQEDEDFKSNVYEGLGMLMSGQSQLVTNQADLNQAIFRIHHFVKPHAGQFYPTCPECQFEKEEIEAEDEGSVTLTKREK